MPDLPTIVVLCEKPAQKSYYSQMLFLAQYSVIEGGRVEDPDFWFLQGQVEVPMASKGRVLSMEKLGLPQQARAATVILALIKNRESSNAVPQTIKIGDAVLHPFEGLWVSSQTGEIRLTEKEVQIILLLKGAGVIIPRSTLLSQIWGYKDGIDTHTLETHIYRLRQKIEQNPSNPKIILTYDEGYKICDD